MRKLLSVCVGAAMVIGTSLQNSQAWDHPGHMTTAAIAFAEVKRMRPDLIEKIGLLLLKHPAPPAFWVAAGDGKGEERARRMFIEAARWPDDAKFTIDDRPTWHTARWPILGPDAPEEAKEIAETRGDRPTGNAIEAAVLNAGMLANPESKPVERALALSWVMHIVGDIHQPLHVSDYYSAESPTGNAAGTLEYVWDPLMDSAMPLHILWDSNTFRSTAIEEIDKNATELLAKYPRSSLPQLTGYDGLGSFERWARESYQVAVDFAYGAGIETAGDPNKDTDSDRLIANMAKYILEGISPLDEAPEVPEAYWEELQDQAHRRIALAGYRIADIIVYSADRIFSDRALAGKVLDALPRHGPTQ